MSQYTLTVPDDIYALARQIAEDTAQPVEQVLQAHLKMLAVPLAALPLDEQVELHALRQLSDDALWTIAREQMPQAAQDHMQMLMDKNRAGTISEDEYRQLAQAVERGNRLMLRKAEAAGILMERGHSFKQSDFQAPDA